MAIHEERMSAFMNQAFGEIAAAMSVPLTILGERLGLYRALKDGGAATPAELAARTGTAERYVREWAQNQAAAGFLAFASDSGKYSLPEEQAAALADEQSPYFLHGAFEIVSSMFADLDRMERAFKDGRGVPWSDHDAALFRGTERFFRPAYQRHLVSEWIPALSRHIKEQLTAGGRIADVGCGHGASSILLAQAFPNSTIVASDPHAPSIDRAREAAKRAGPLSNLSFEVAGAADFRGREFDLVLTLDCLHDMGDPIGAARHILLSMRDSGSWMIVEPFAHDLPEKNLNPVGRVYYAASTLVCVPASLASSGPALGAQAGEARIRDIVTRAGFTRFRRASETPFNLVFEAQR